jgi:hypothetical protein
MTVGVKYNSTCHRRPQERWFEMFVGCWFPLPLKRKECTDPHRLAKADRQYMMGWANGTRRNQVRLMD